MPESLEEIRAREMAQWINHFGYNHRAFEVISQHVGIHILDVPAWLVNAWRAWRAHRDYDIECDVFPFKQRQAAEDPYNPKVVGVFEHDVEKDGPGDGPESYIISGLMDVISSIKWGERSLGPFKEIIPVWPDCPTHTYRQLVWGFSWKGAGGASRCRLRLKALLPEEYHRYITLARQYNGKPKCWHMSKALMYYDGWTGRRLAAAVDARAYPPGYEGRWSNYSLFNAMKVDRNLQPDGYRRHTKAQIFADAILRVEVPHIEEWIDADDFWKAATGRCRPDEVLGLMRMHQPDLFELEDEGVPRKKKSVAKQPRQRPAMTQLQLIPRENPHMGKE